MNSPALSIIVVVHRSPRQARLVLESLSPDYQQGVPVPYEVLVVEAESDEPLGAESALASGSHVRYLNVPAGPAWRARAVEVGVRCARAPWLGLLQDGAHLMTPGVIASALGALADRARALVVVADYCFDPKKVDGAGSIDAELLWLGRARWKESPRSLFEAAMYGPAAINGPLSPLLGASVMFFSKASFEAIPGLDPSLDRPGSGALRLHLFTQLCRLAGTELVALVGEGAFRLTHPEVTTETARWDESSPERSMVSAVLPQGPTFTAVIREPRPYGAVGPEARPHVERSAALAEWHCVVCKNKGEPSWYEDPR